jgi:hypothetical protein
VNAEIVGGRIAAVALEDRRNGGQVSCRAPYVLDATELGDLLPLAGIEHLTGAEAQSEYGEPHAPATAQPLNMQGITYCFAVSHHDGANHVIDKPKDYEFWRTYQPDFWPGPLLGFAAPDPRTLEAVPRSFVPNPSHDPLDVEADQSANAGDRELWMFRRILARSMHEPGAFESDVSLVNWPLNDYWLKPPLGDDAESALAEAKQLSLSVLYWLQTEAPRADGGTGYPGLRLRHDIVGTADGLAKSPYIRESRRIRARTTVTEHDVSLDIVGPYGGTRYDDSVGIGSYRIDLHPSTGGDNYIDIASVPFEIPLGALIPAAEGNLLAAGKNIGTTHISNGCYRLHPVEWNIGEAAGHLAAFCLSRNIEPYQVHSAEKYRDDFCQVLDRG